MLPLLRWHRKNVRGDRSCSQFDVDFIANLELERTLSRALIYKDTPMLTRHLSNCSSFYQARNLQPFISGAMSSLQQVANAFIRPALFADEPF